MSEFAFIIQSKMSKLENSCSDLREEIYTTLQFVIRLKENFTEIVKKLNSTTEPELFLKEFIYVHSFVLKYLSFLTEINCKFKILEISEMNTQLKEDSENKALKSKIMPDRGNKSVSNVSLSTKASKNKSKKKNKKKKMKASETKSNSKCTPTITASIAGCDGSTNNNHKKVENNSQDIGSTIQTDSSTTSKLVDALNEANCSDANVVHSDMILHPNDNNANISGSSNEIMPYSETSSLRNCLNQDDKKKLQNENPAHLTETDLHIKSLVDRTQPSVTDVSEIKAVSEETRTCDFSQEALNKNEIKPAKLEKKLGKEYDVVIEHIKSPSEFYISVVNSQPNLLVELEKKLKFIPENKKKCNKTHDNRKVCLSKEIGTYALFYSKCDEMWYRARIINWCLNLKDEYVCIFLIDYGESKCVSIDDLQPMPECFKKYPACIQRCHLFGIFPLDMHRNSEMLSWGKESTEKMKCLTENSKKVKIRIASDDCYHPPTSLPVTLWLTDKGNQCVNEMLVKSKYALEKSDLDQSLKKTETSDSKFTESPDLHLHNWNPMKEDFESYKNSYDLDMNDPAALIYGYVGKDYERVCSNFAKTGYCYKGQACRKEHKKLDPLGFTTDQEEVFKNAFNSLRVPPPKTILNVQVTCLLSYNSFCCISDISTSSFDEENLQTLLKFMNKPNNVLQMKKLLIPPSTGQIVIARYSQDRSWYRARILDSEPEKDLYRIVFVDYGNKEVVPLSDIRAVEARYLHLPFQAIECFISGIDRNPEIPMKDVIYYINKRMNDGNVSIEVVAELPGESTRLLVNVFDENGRNIGNDLIEKEYVIRKQEIIISPETASIPG